MRTVARLGAVAMISAFVLGAIWTAYGTATEAAALTRSVSPRVVPPALVAPNNAPQSTVTPPSRVVTPASPPRHRTATQPRAPAPGPAAFVVRTTEQALINQDRARYGLAPLTWSSC